MKSLIFFFIVTLFIVILPAYAAYTGSHVNLDYLDEIASRKGLISSDPSPKNYFRQGSSLMGTPKHTHVIFRELNNLDSVELAAVFDISENAKKPDITFFQNSMIYLNEHRLACGIVIALIAAACVVAYKYYTALQIAKKER